MDIDVVLIIEDDATLLRGLNDNFRFKGYKVLTANDGRNGLDLALQEHPDVVILDIMMPEMDGYEVCKRIRKAGLEMPIIMLTAKGREEDIIRGLNAGAHDYMTKPFSIKELLARAGSLLKRYRRSLPDTFRFGDCDVNMVSHKLFRDGQEVALTPKEFGLLIYFIRHLGRALTRDDIMQEVWGSDILVTPRSVDRCINTLRQKIEPAGSRPVFIQTIRDIGYRFEVPDEHQCDDVNDSLDLYETTRSSAEKSWTEDLVMGQFCLKSKLTTNNWIAERGNEVVSILKLPWLKGEPEALDALKDHCLRLRELESPVLNHNQEIVEFDGMPCYVERFYSEINLSDQIKTKPLLPSSARQLLISLVSALKIAHKKGLFHGNVAPETVVFYNEVPRLLHNGLALASHLVFGSQMKQWDELTMSSQSPQRLMGKGLAATDDIFSLGVLYYTALVGKGPFEDTHPLIVSSHILTKEPLSLIELGFDKKIWRIIAHTLEKDADDRFQSARDLEFALSDFE